MKPMILTVGHSTRSAERFQSLLQAHDVTGVADVRTVPRSWRHPHFSQESLAGAWPVHGISYEHFPALGGLRKPLSDSRHGGWINAGFRGYADYMDTPEFRSGLEALLSFAHRYRAAVMCAEATWWKCHRRLIADALAVRGVAVCHIMSVAEASQHLLTPFARVEGLDLRYPSLV